MRTVVSYMLVSVDGVAEAPELFVLDFDEVMEDHLRRTIEAQDDVLLGRRMYDEWSRFWPGSPMEPFAGFINAVPKHVATSTPLDGDWPGAVAVDGPVEDHVRRLREAEGGDIGVHGSITLTRSLLAAGLVDELHLVVAPRVAGHGRRLFADGPSYGLGLAEATATPSGSLLLRYTTAAG